MSGFGSSMRIGPLRGQEVPMLNRAHPRASRLPRLLDIAGVAEHLGVSERHVRRLVAERRIPFIKWGHLLRFDPEEVADWVDCGRRRPA
jgi:excisionase family DNA binding protein